MQQYPLYSFVSIRPLTPYFVLCRPSRLAWQALPCFAAYPSLNGTRGSGAVGSGAHAYGSQDFRRLTKLKSAQVRRVCAWPSSSRAGSCLHTWDRGAGGPSCDTDGRDTLEAHEAQTRIVADSDRRRLG